MAHYTEGGALGEWADNWFDWYRHGRELAKREESGDVPDPDEYADYDDEAARLLILAAELLGVPKPAGTDDVKDELSLEALGVPGYGDNEEHGEES